MDIIALNKKKTIIMDNFTVVKDGRVECVRCKNQQSKNTSEQHFHLASCQAFGEMFPEDQLFLRSCVPVSIVGKSQKKKELVEKWSRDAKRASGIDVESPGIKRSRISTSCDSMTNDESCVINEKIAMWAHKYGISWNAIDTPEFRDVCRCVIAMREFGKSLLSEFDLDPKYTNLNHGSFGCVPTSVRLAHQSLLLEQERRPDAWFRNIYLSRMTEMRKQLAEYVGADVDSLVLVENASSAVNSVLASYAFKVVTLLLCMDIYYLIVIRRLIK